MTNTTPIGVFDSGIGGLSVLREIRKQLPSADIVYLADQAFAPYGERSLDNVRTRVSSIVTALIDAGCGPIVMACNTASAAALHHVRRLHGHVVFVGMEPAVKPAAETTGAGVIGVLATPATFQSELYASVVDRHGEGVEVIAQPAPGLVELVEARRPNAARPLLEMYLQPMIDAGIDRLVLGCTHYPFLMDQIRALLPDHVEVIDPAPAVARQVARVAVGSGSAGERHLTTRPSELTTVVTDVIEFADV